MKSKDIDLKRIETICQFLDNPDNHLPNLLSDQNFKETINVNTQLVAGIATAILPLDPEDEVVKSEPIHLRSSSHLEHRDFLLDPPYRLYIRKKNKKDYGISFMEWSVQPIGQEMALARWENIEAVVDPGADGYLKPGNTFYTVVLMEGLFNPSQVNSSDGGKSTDIYTVLRLTSLQAPYRSYDGIAGVHVQLENFHLQLDDLDSVRDCLFYTLKHSSTLRRKDVLKLVEKGGCVVAEFIDAAYTKARKKFES